MILLLAIPMGQIRQNFLNFLSLSVVDFGWYYLGGQQGIESNSHISKARQDLHHNLRPVDEHLVALIITLIGNDMSDVSEYC